MSCLGRGDRVGACFGLVGFGFGVTEDIPSKDDECYLGGYIYIYLVTDYFYQS